MEKESWSKYLLNPCESRITPTCLPLLALHAFFCERVEIRRRNNASKGIKKTNKGKEIIDEIHKQDEIFLIKPILFFRRMNKTKLKKNRWMSERKQIQFVVT